jgi:hypothetical protein
MQSNKLINKNKNRHVDSTISMTNCQKGGIKIRDTGNNNAINPFSQINPFNIVTEQKPIQVTHNQTSCEKLDLNINNYSREDLLKLFGVLNIDLTEEIMKDCKKIVLKSHPDKSQLHEKYFLFFSEAYKKLRRIYEFQNKFKIDNSNEQNEYYDSNQANILDNILKEKYTDPKKFNNWFNEQFEQHKTIDINENGYGTWLKSDDDIVFTSNVSKANMNSEIEKRKKQVQSLTTYNGVHDPYASTFGGSSLMTIDNNFSSASLFNSDGIGYTDLRKAYVESVIPVTEEDFHKIQKFNNVEEYKRHRDSVEINPILSSEESMRQLYQKDKQKDEESSALAFYFAQQTEKAINNNNKFWSKLKQLTNL